MSSDVVIQADRLGKKYVIGHQTEREKYTALRDVIARGAQSWARSLRDLAKGAASIAGDEFEEFWALKDVSFEIKRGDVVGVIGRNGAGKSTLLKILSRITEPSEGRIEIRGRVASLLEVGTGFHPELTGRENIFLNGAILGMSRAEIKAKFDEIVAFSEVEKFLDTPVKRYSSGMYVRLAFAVAAHLEPEILIVDEVLAVGDAEFQKKCLGKMQDVAGHGRTVLFVSHNMSAIKSLCKKSVYLISGQVAAIGPVDEVLDRYLAGQGDTNWRGRQVYARGDVLIDHEEAQVQLVFDIKLFGPLHQPHLGLGVHDASGTRILTILSETAERLPPVAAGAAIHVRLTTEPIRLAPGALSVKVDLADSGLVLESHPDALKMLVQDYNPFACQPHARPNGALLVRHSLSVNTDIPSSHAYVS